ncbi:hypothetical protein F6V30_14120 [Oryzomonas sagensis]|uniref:Uncharacterized protein n=1 Tax=Oryzomonas sagensis TaxID=2603857 RepID=A0ABQ6TLA3_9BACT|nr:hypothetical protein [Oryzomonas sagensis]KAB0668969.1 hypothetical protein F6V30_14120 [Oryzomonas sagensis]
MNVILQPSRPTHAIEERIIVDGRDIGRIYPGNDDPDNRYGCQLSFQVGEYINCHGHGPTKYLAVQAAIYSAICAARDLNDQAAALMGIDKEIAHLAELNAGDTEEPQKEASNG